MDSMSIQMNGFSSVAVISVFNSWYMNHFCGALTLLFCFFGYLLLPIGILFYFMFFDFYLTLNLLDELKYY